MSRRNGIYDLGAKWRNSRPVLGRLPAGICAVAHLQILGDDQYYFEFATRLDPMSGRRSGFGVLTELSSRVGRGQSYSGRFKLYVEVPRIASGRFSEG